MEKWDSGWDREERKIMSRALSVLIGVTIVLLLLGASTQYVSNRQRFFWAGPPALLFYFIALFLNNRDRMRLGAMVYSLTLIYVSGTTIFFADPAILHNNPLVPITVSLMVMAAFSFYKRDLVLLLTLSLGLMVFYSFRHGGTATGESIDISLVVIATVLNLLFLGIPAFIIVSMNYRRMIKSLQFSESVSRIIQGEKLKGSELLIPVITHEVSGDLGNAAVLVSLLKEQALVQQGMDKEELQNLLTLLETHIERLRGIFSRYRSKLELHSEPSRGLPLGEVLQTITAHVKLSLPQQGSVDISYQGDPGVALQQYRVLGAVIFDLVENVYIHAFSSETENPALVITWKWYKDSRKLEIILADNGQGFHRNPEEYFISPQMVTYQGRSKAAMGLYFCHMRMEHHFQGEIRVDSSPEGARVRLFIPGDFVRFNI